MPAWSAKTRRAPSRRCRDARVYGHTTTAMRDLEYIPRPPPPPPPHSTLPHLWPAHHRHDQHHYPRSRLHQHTIVLTMTPTTTTTTTNTTNTTTTDAAATVMHTTTFRKYINGRWRRGGGGAAEAGERDPPSERPRKSESEPPCRTDLCPGTPKSSFQAGGFHCTLRLPLDGPIGHIYIYFEVYIYPCEDISSVGRACA